MTFIDSNVLVYSIDSRDIPKHQMARAIISKAKNAGDYLISAQVLNEFANVALRKLGIAKQQTLAALEKFSAIRVVPVRPEWSPEAIRIMEQYGTQFYDALLIAAASANGCDEILTEDLTDGQVYCGVKAVNPFK